MNTPDINTIIHQAMAKQLSNWRNELSDENQRLGWKVGYNRVQDQEKAGLPSLMIGYLTTERQIDNGGICKASAGSTLLAEAEIALQMGADITVDMTPQQAQASVSAIAPAIEIVDTSRVTSGEIGDILAGNLFHEAVVIGDPLSLCSVPGKQEVRAELQVNGEVQRTLEEDRVPEEFGTLITVVASILAKQGERLCSGDWIITGAATTPIAVSPGDKLSLTMPPLGDVSLQISH